VPESSVDLYNTSYGKYDRPPYPAIRLETYGEDFGQTSWVTTAESAEIPRLLQLTSDALVLEVGCGSGRYAIHLAEEVGCEIVGVDINEEGIRNATRLASAAAHRPRVRFDVCDASRPLAFGTGEFDAVYSNDVLCHIPGRLALFRELHRVVRSGGTLLFSDALVVGGVVSHEEIATRSSIGYYLFSPPGENERLLREAGWTIEIARDTTRAACEISMRWHSARLQHETALIALEGEATFRGLQKFLACVHRLTDERRLLRQLYVART
jgi:SAM-dependent methyltransferase